MLEEKAKSRRGKEPKGDARYHNTWLLLRKYRDVTWSMEVSVAQAKRMFNYEFGMTMEEFLDTMYSAGMDFSDTKLTDHVRGLQKSYSMLKLLDSAIEILQTKHRHGEEYYWILYYTYLSPQEYGNVDDIVEALLPHMRDISRRTYYRKRREAIEALSSLLWGYMDKETMEMLEGVLIKET